MTIIRTNQNRITHAGDQNQGEALSVMNLQAAADELQLPYDIIIALAHCGFIRANMEAQPPMLSSDDVIELAAKIEHLRDQRDARERTDEIADTETLLGHVESGQAEFIFHSPERVSALSTNNSNNPTIL